MQLAKWGNSLAVRIPSPVINAMGLQAGDEIEIVAAGSAKLELVKKPDAMAILARLDKYRGALPADFKFDRFEANLRDSLRD